MAKISINYLFPPEQIQHLPTWRFVLHFKAPLAHQETRLNEAIAGLKSAKWKIIQFPFGIEHIAFNGKRDTVAVPIEVTQERRSRPTSLADYESDVWKICGHMNGAGFGDLYYEAIDWNET